MTESPCWDGYEQIGKKMKNGKKVPNCVPIKRAKTLSTLEEQDFKIEAAALALIKDANFEFSGTRRVTEGAALEIVARSISKNADEPFSVRQHRALVELSHYITLAQHNRVMASIDHTDLLPVAHPRSTRLNGLTAAALLKARARWITDDPAIDDQNVKTLLASALTTHVASAERQYALARLESFPEGQIPQYALVAAFGDGYSSEERRINAEQQLRDRRGRFVYMGGSLRALVRRLDGRVQNLVGKVVGRDGAKQELHMELPDGRIVRIPAAKGDAVKAVIPSQQSKDGYGDVVSVSAADPVINEAELEFLDAPGAFEKDEAWTPNKDDADYYGDIDLGEQFSDGLHDVIKVENNQYAKDQFEAANQREAEGQRVVANGDGENDALDPNKPVYIVKRKDGDGRPFAVVQNWGAVQDFVEQDGPRIERDEQPDPARVSELDKPKPKKEPQAVIPSAQEAPQAPQADAEVAPTEQEAKALTPTKEGDFRPTSDPKDRGFGFVFKKGKWVKATSDDRDANRNEPKGQDTDTSDIVDARKLEEGMTVKNPDGSTKTILKITKEKSKRPSDKAGKAPSIEEYTTVEYDDGSTDSWSTTNGQLGFDVEKPYFEVIGGKEGATRAPRPEAPGLLIPKPGQGRPGLDNERPFPNFPQGNEYPGGGRDWQLPENLMPGNRGPVTYLPYDPNNPGPLIPGPGQGRPGQGSPGLGPKPGQGRPNLLPYNPPADTGRPRRPRRPRPEGEAPATPQAEIPAEPAAPQRKVKEQPKRFRDSFKKGFKEGLKGWKSAPEGFYDIDRENFEPEGALEGQTSPDFTDDPAELAQRFTSEQLQDALENAVSGSKQDPATGFGQLPFEQGDEIVPADALFQALEEQGVDANQILNDIYAPKKNKKREAKASLPVDEETKNAEGIDVPKAAIAEDAIAEVPPLIEGQTAEEQRNFIDNGDYKSYLPENLEPEVVPEGYVALDGDPFDVEGTAIPEDAPEGFSVNPVDIALSYDKEDLKNELRRSIEPGNAMPGYGILAQEDENGEIYEAYVPAEAIRDALQLQGEDTNKLIDDIYKEGAEQPSAQEIADAMEGENAKEESAQPEESPAQDAQGPNTTGPEAGLPADNGPGGVQGVEEAPEGAAATTGVVTEGSQEADLAMGEPRREMVRAADLQPGDIAVRDGEYFVIEEVATPAAMSEGGQKDKGRNRITVKGYYPGHQTQERSWFANGNIEVIRGVAAPAKGDGPALDKPELADYGKMKKIDGEWGVANPVAQAKYEADLAAHKAAIQAAGADFFDPTKKEAEEGLVDKAQVADAMPAANAPVIAKLKAADLQVGDIALKDHFRITKITNGDGGKLLIEGHYPGQGLQTKQWWPNTRVEVIRGIPEDQAPQLGEGSLHRPAGRGPKGGWFPIDDTNLNAEHEAKVAEAKDRWNAPAGVPVVASNDVKGEDKLDENIKLPPKPREPAYPAFMGKFAEWAREAGGDWAEFKKKLAGQDIIVFDFETTGIDVKDGNEPWQIAAVKMRDGKIVDRINIFMNPGKSLKGTYAGENAKDPDGNLLTDEFFADKPSQAEGLQQFLDWAGTGPLAVAQNAKFDDEVMKRKAAELGLTWEPSGMADTMGMAAEIFKDAPDAPDRKSLGVIAEFLGIKNDNWHDGLNDAEVTAQAFTKLIDLAAEGNYGVGALDADAQQAAYDAKMAALQPRIDEFNKAATDFLAKKALRDGLAGKEVNLEAIQKEIPTPLPEGPIDNVGAMDNPEQASKPQADLIDVNVDSAFPEGKMRIAEPEFAQDLDKVDVIPRGDIKVNDLRPGDFVHAKKDDPEFFQVVSIRGGEEFGVEEQKRRVVVQNAEGVQRVVFWRQNAFLDEVRRPKNRAELAGEPMPAAERTPEDVNMQAVTVARGNAALEIKQDGEEFVAKGRILDDNGKEIYTFEGRYLTQEGAEAEGKALLRRRAVELAEQARRNEGKPESKEKSVSIGLEPANVDQLPVIELIEDLPVGEGQNEITPRIAGDEIVFQSDARVVDDGEVVAQITEDFPSQQAASQGGRDNVDAMAVAFAEKFAKDREELLLRSEGRGRRNLPPIPDKYRRQVYIRALAGLYADRNGDPLAAGDKVVHQNPAKAKALGKGVVVRKVQGNNGGLQRKGVVYVDYVMVQYEGDPEGQLRKHNARMLEHIDKKVAQERFDAEPRINWMNPEEKAQAVVERNKKPRKGGSEAIDAADVEVEEIVAEIDKAVTPEVVAPIEAPISTPEPEAVSEPEVPAAAAAGDPFVELTDVKAIQAKLAELRAQLPKFKGKGEKAARWAGREIERLIAELDVRPLDRAGNFALLDAISWARAIGDQDLKNMVVPELENLLDNIRLKKNEIYKARIDKAIADLKKPIDGDLIPDVATKDNVIKPLQEFIDRLPTGGGPVDVDRNLYFAGENLNFILKAIQRDGENDFDKINPQDLLRVASYIRAATLDVDAQKALADELDKLLNVIKIKAKEDSALRNAEFIERLNQPFATDLFPENAAQLTRENIQKAIDGVLKNLPTVDETEADKYLRAAAINLIAYRKDLETYDPDVISTHQIDRAIDSLRQDSDARRTEVADKLFSLRQLIIDNKAQFKDKRLADYNNRLAQPFDSNLIPVDPVDFNKDILEKAVLAIKEKLPLPQEIDVHVEIRRAADHAQRLLDAVQNMNPDDEEAALRNLNERDLRMLIQNINTFGNEEEKKVAAFAQQAYNQLLAKKNLLKGEARDKFLARRDVELPENITPEEGKEDKKDFVDFVGEFVKRLPRDEDEDVDARPIMAFKSLESFLDELNSASDVFKTPQGDLTEAIQYLNKSADAKYRELGQNLQDMQDFINLRLMNRPIQPFAGINLEEVDPIALAEERVANGENLFDPSVELQAEFANDDLYTNEPFLAPFKSELQEFFSGKKTSLAKLDLRARQALSQKIAASLKQDIQTRNPEQVKELVALAIALREERDIYQPQREELGVVGNRLLSLDPEKLADAIRRTQKDLELKVDGQATGFKGKPLSGGHANAGYTFMVTDLATGQKFVFKGERSVKEARAEYEAARVAAALNIGGRVYTELFGDKSRYLIQTLAGDTLRLAESPIDHNKTQKMDRETANRANMVDLVSIALLDAVINNTDRHGGNFQDAPADKVGVAGNGHEELYLLPIDHGFAAALNDGATPGLESAKRFFLGTAGRALGDINRALGAKMGAAAYKELMDMTIQQAMQNLQRTNGTGLRPQKFTMVIERLKELRSITIPELQRWAGKP